MNWEIRQTLDSKLLETNAEDLSQLLSGPTVFDLSQEEKQPFFVATLLHGNERSGWDAARKFIRDNPGASLVLLVGNVAAAAKGMRHLLDEPDFNRVWRQEPWQSRLVQLLQDTNPWCGIDIHNNSGPNPHYAVVTDRKPETLALATLFSDKLIYTEHTLDILGHALAHYCPALTIETGAVGDPQAVPRAYELLTTLNEMDATLPTIQQRLNAFETLGIVTVEGGPADFSHYPRFVAALERCSFQTLDAGSLFIERITDGWQINVANPARELDLTDEYLDFRNEQVYLKKDIVLSMFTSDPLLASQDCVCYFLKHSSLVYG